MTDILQFGGNVIDKHVGARLRLHRMARGLSIEEVAELGSITKTLIDQYEGGRRRVPAKDIFAFCQIYTIKPADIF